MATLKTGPLVDQTVAVSSVAAAFLQKAAATLFAQSVAVTSDGDDVAVVKQTVQDGCRDNRVAERFMMPFSLKGSSVAPAP